jgi:hypothetical protein
MIQMSVANASVCSALFILQVNWTFCSGKSVGKSKSTPMSLEECDAPLTLQRSATQTWEIASI